MPTERFNRLPHEKREIIRQAAVDEFARVTYDKVSINQIIQRADISRGSFYTYFEDKLDVLRYIFEEMKSDMTEFCKTRVLESHGDYWHVMDGMLDFFLRTCYEHRLLEIVRNMRVSSEANFFTMFEGHENEAKDATFEVWLYEHIDKSNLKIGNKEDFHSLLDMCMMNLMATVGELFKSNGDVEYIKKIFYKKLEILRYGVCK